MVTLCGTACRLYICLKINADFTGPYLSVECRLVLLTQMPSQRDFSHGWLAIFIPQLRASSPSDLHYYNLACYTTVQYTNIFGLTTKLGS